MGVSPKVTNQPIKVTNSDGWGVWPIKEAKNDVIYGPLKHRQSMGKHGKSRDSMGVPGKAWQIPGWHGDSQESMRNSGKAWEIPSIPVMHAKSQECTDPPQYGRWHIRNIFGIGPRVPELGPNFGQIFQKIAISREPLVRFG